MSIFKNQPIVPIQTWKGRILEFDPDASPAAWEHYKHYYSETFKTYNICSPSFFSYDDCQNGYTLMPPRHSCRLYALPKGIVPFHDKQGNEYYKAVLRLSGETDFNFNEKHYSTLEIYLKHEPEYLLKLKKCKEQQHCLLNFSLMQTMGNMQGFKGIKCDDRLDRFIYYLGEFFENGADNKLGEYIQKGDKDILASKSNRMKLKDYLNQFGNLTDYFKKIYFISDEKFIEKLRLHGQKDLNTSKNVKTYIDIVYCFWEKKDFYFSQKEYITIGSYFSEGGEVYTYKELSYKLTNDLGVTDQREIDVIIEKCLNRGFIYQCDNNCYTRQIIVYNRKTFAKVSYINII